MSGIGKLDSSDWFKGLIVTVLGGGLSIPVQAIQAGGPINWKQAGVFAGVAGLSYLLKNLGTNTQGEVLGIAATAPKQP